MAQANAHALRFLTGTLLPGRWSYHLQRRAQEIEERLPRYRTIYRRFPATALSVARRHPEVEVVAEAENGVQAMELVVSASPDLLLLDIQMPQGNCLDIAACLPTPRPAIIFCTAFDQHTVDSFELNALDYLLKPLSRVRLEEALVRDVRNDAKDPDSSL